MKTGGTMNFLKRAGAILMLVAVFASSCNKYADDFKQLNTKLDALATTVAGVTTLTTNMAALQAQVTALQSAVAALPTTASITALNTSLTNVNTKIDGIVNTLKTISDAGKATDDVIAGIKSDLKTLSDKVTADNAAMAASLLKLTNNDVDQSAQLKQLIDSNNDILAKIAAAQTSLNGLTDSQAAQATQASVDALNVMLQAQKVQLAIIMANTAMYNGDVNVTSDAEVTFYLAKIAQLGIVNGSVNVNLAAISASQLVSARLITSKINAIIGNTGATPNTLTVNFKQSDAINLSTLVSVAGAVTINGTAKGAGVDVDLSMLSSVGGTLTLNYDGPYQSTSLTKVGGDLDLVNKAVVAATTPQGTTSINIPNVTVGGLVGDVAGPATGVVTFPLATDVVLAGGVSSLTAVKAINVKLGAATYATGLTINTPLATTVDLSAATTVTAPGTLAITADATANVMLDNFTTTTALPINVIITGPTTVVLPKYVAGTLLAPAATTVTLAKHEWFAPAILPAVTTLTLGNLANLINLAAYPTLVSVDISGKAQTTWVATATSVITTAGNANLKTVKLGGNIGGAYFSTCPLLTSFTTSGSVNFLAVDAMAALTALNLGHTYFVPTNAANGGPGSDLIITNNPKLTALKSSGDYPRIITVTGNALLTSIDLSSYVTKLLAAPLAMTTITINTNKLSAAYTNAVAITPTTPYVETTITSADLHTLKALVASYPTVAPFLPGITLNVDLDAVKIGAGGATSLSAKMVLDAASTTIVNGPAPRLASIDSQAEFALVQ